MRKVHVIKNTSKGVPYVVGTRSKSHAMRALRLAMPELFDFSRIEAATGRKCSLKVKLYECNDYGFRFEAHVKYAPHGCKA